MRKNPAGNQNTSSESVGWERPNVVGTDLAKSHSPNSRVDGLKPSTAGDLNLNLIDTSSTRPVCSVFKQSKERASTSQGATVLGKNEYDADDCDTKLGPIEMAAPDVYKPNRIGARAHQCEGVVITVGEGGHLVVLAETNRIEREGCIPALAVCSLHQREGVVNALSCVNLGDRNPRGSTA